MFWQISKIQANKNRKCHVCQPEMSLYEAIRDNNSKKVKSILAKNGKLVHSTRRYGSPLLIAAEGGFTDIIKILLKYGADINAVDSNGWSPLISACHFNHNDAVCLLLESGADANLKCQLGNTAMHAAALNNSVKNIKALKDHGACVNSVNVDGWAPIHRATYSNRANAVKFLLEECGADPTLRSHSGKTPYEIALQMRLDDLAHLIRKHESKSKKSTTTAPAPTQQQRPLPTRVEPQGQPESATPTIARSNDNNSSTVTTSNIATPGPNLQTRLTEFKDFAIRLFSANRERGNSVQQRSVPLPQRRPTPGDDSTSLGDSDDEEGSKDECPICFEIPLPPTHIYQCTNGHIYCGKCKESPNMEKCPQCGIDISQFDNRNRYAEEHIAQIYKNNKTSNRR